MRILPLIKILYLSYISVKNNIAILVLHIWRGHEIIAKTVYHVMNILSTKAELFAIRCRISQASQI